MTVRDKYSRSNGSTLPATGNIHYDNESNIRQFHLQELRDNSELSAWYVYAFLCFRQRSGRWHYVFGLSVSLSACASRTLSTQYFENYWTYFHPTFSFSTFRGKMNDSSFEVKRSKFKATVGSNVPENALFDLIVLTLIRATGGGGIPECGFCQKSHSKQ